MEDWLWEVTKTLVKVKSTAINSKDGFQLWPAMEGVAARAEAQNQSGKLKVKPNKFERGHIGSADLSN